METDRSMAEQLCGFIRKSPSCYHVVENFRQELLDRKFVELREEDAWNLERGGRYFVTRNHSSIISFQIPERRAASLHMIASHSDSPTFKIKQNPEIKGAGHTVRLNIEGYGGMLCSPWFDRPLGVAGRVFVEEERGIREALVSPDSDMLLIPSLAIHMNRQANSEASCNIQEDMLPLFAMEGSTSFEERIAAEAGLSPRETDKIIGMDLFLVNRTEPVLWGGSREFLSAPRLDDLECAFCTFRGFLESLEKTAGDILPVHIVFDNEETGSRTKQGADSTFLTDTLERIREKMGTGAEEWHRAIARSFLVSADNAHAVHPNFQAKADPVLRPSLNGGIVLKYHANQQYTTDGGSEAVFRSICRRHRIPFQCFANRADMRGGSTLGNILSSHLSVRTVDVGLPQLAMHSPYETAGSRDPEALLEFSRAFYGEELPEMQE